MIYNEADDISLKTELIIAINNNKEKQADEIVENIMIGLIVYKLEDINDDRTLRIIYVNPAAEFLRNKKKEDMIGKTMDEVFPNARKQEIPQKYARVAREKKIDIIDDLSFTEDNQLEHAYTIKAFPLSDNCVGIAIENETARKKAELDLLKEKENAEAANTSKTQFLANMSHEIRTPLNGVLGMLQLLETTDLTDEQKYFINTSKKSSNSLLRIINDILDYARIESKKMILENIDFNIYNLFEEMTELFRPALQEKDIKINILIDEELPEIVTGDVFRIRQILSNMIGNAIKFTNEGEIKIIAEKMGKIKNNKMLIGFEIFDTGIGIPRDKLKDIFQSFTQVDYSNTRKYGGSGLGLAICKGLIEQMNGDIWVQSTEEIGSSFCFNISLGVPIGRDMIHFDTDDFGFQHNNFLNKKFSFKKDSESKKIHVLIAEDDLVSRMVIEKIAEKKGWKAKLADNATKAIEYFKNERFDVVLMDIQMPEVDGYQATRIIRDIEENELNTNIFDDLKVNARTPIIAMTAYALRGDREKCLAAGMDDYISKPLSANELNDKVEKWSKKYEIE